MPTLTGDIRMPLEKTAASHRMTATRLQRLDFAVTVSERIRRKQQPSLLMTRQGYAVADAGYCAKRR